MVRLALHSIAYEAKTLNLAKAGYTAFYVDGTHGSDAHDGGSWGQAFKTIQHALDESEPWTKIYIRDGTYSEFLTIATNNITLRGESRTGTIISAPSNDWNAVAVDSNNVDISNLKVVAISPTSSIITSSDYLKLTDIDYTRWLYLRGSYAICDNLYSATHGIAISGDRNTVTGCLVENAPDGIYISDDTQASNFNMIINNEIRNGTRGIYIEKLLAESQHNTITHNNLIGNTTQILDEGLNNKFFENFYDDHTNVDNGFGIAKTPYTFTTGTDPRPVTVRNGWLGLSWADADQVGDIKSRNVSMMEFWSDNDDSIALSPGITNVVLPDVIVANLPAGISIIRVTGMINIRELYNNSANANAINGAALIKVKKSTGAWVTDDVDLINIPDNSFPMEPSSIHAARTYVGDNDASSKVDGNATYNLRFDGNCAVDHSFLYLRDVAVGLRVYFTA